MRAEDVRGGATIRLRDGSIGHVLRRDRLWKEIAYQVGHDHGLYWLPTSHVVNDGSGLRLGELRVPDPDNA